MPSLWPPIIRWRWGHSATCVLLSSPHLSLECFLPRAEESAPVSVFLDPLEVSPGGFDLLPPPCSQFPTVSPHPQLPDTLRNGRLSSLKEHSRRGGGRAGGWAGWARRGLGLRLPAWCESQAPLGRLLTCRLPSSPADGERD